MVKPTIADQNILMSHEWFLEALKAIDRRSYGSGGILEHEGGEESIKKIAKEIILMDIEELKKCY